MVVLYTEWVVARAGDALVRVTSPWKRLLQPVIFFLYCNRE